MSSIIHPDNNFVNSNGVKIIFMGTPDFAVPILEKLIASEYKPVAVFCAPDKPVGRRQILTPPPVKIAAQKYNIPVYQPADASELLKQLTTLRCDLIITAAFGIILPKAAVEAPRFGCLNIHPSILPKYRGPSPIQAAILNGDTATGVTIYKMDKKVDTGPIIAQEKISMNNAPCPAAAGLPPLKLRGGEGELSQNIKKYTAPELSQILSALGADLLLKTLPDWLAGQITPTPQEESQATYTKIITKQDGQINWQKSAQEIERQIRAYTPWPGSHTYYSSSEAERVEKFKLKIINADAMSKKSDGQSGEVFLTESDELAIQTGQGALVIKELQLEGGKPLSAADFLRGHKDIVGQILK